MRMSDVQDERGEEIVKSEEWLPVTLSHHVGRRAAARKNRTCGFRRAGP